MKRLIKLLFLLAVAGGAIWLTRDRLLGPAPADPSPAPGFRPRPPEPSPMAPTEASPSLVGDDEPAAAAADDLTTITGIGPVFRDRLRTEGITTFSALAAMDVAGVAERIDARQSLVEDWAEQARERAT